jgi:hypothetical protein
MVAVVFLYSAPQLWKHQQRYPQEQDATPRSSTRPTKTGAVLLLRAQWRTKEAVFDGRLQIIKMNKPCPRRLPLTKCFAGGCHYTCAGCWTQMRDLSNNHGFGRGWFLTLMNDPFCLPILLVCDPHKDFAFMGGMGTDATRREVRMAKRIVILAPRAWEPTHVRIKCVGPLYV